MHRLMVAEFRQQSSLEVVSFRILRGIFGRNVVSKTVKVLDNSVFGFKELAGCKIFLKEHQLRTIMCYLQEKNCRVMLADEVGMGKTIEAASVLKVYTMHNSRPIYDELVKNRWK